MRRGMRGRIIRIFNKMNVGNLLESEMYFKKTQEERAERYK